MSSFSLHNTLIDGQESCGLPLCLDSFWTHFFSIENVNFKWWNFRLSQNAG